MISAFSANSLCHTANARHTAGRWSCRHLPSVIHVDGSHRIPDASVQSVCDGLSHFIEDTSGPSVDVREFNLIACRKLDINSTCRQRELNPCWASQPARPAALQFSVLAHRATRAGLQCGLKIATPYMCNVRNPAPIDVYVLNAVLPM